MRPAPFSIPKLSRRATLAAMAFGALLFWGHMWHSERQALAQFSPGVWQALRQPASMTLYSLDPGNYTSENSERPNAPDPLPRFHGYAILGELAVTSVLDREIVAETVREGVRDWDGQLYSCFNPRHGVRVTDATGTHDFVICFECSGIALHSPHGDQSGIGFTTDDRPINAILTTSRIPLAKPH